MLFVSCLVEHCLEGGHRVHVEFRVISFEYVCNCVFGRMDIDWRAVCCLPWFLYSIPSLVFLFESCRKSQIKDGWEGIDLLFHNYFVDSDPR